MIFNTANVLYRITNSHSNIIPFISMKLKPINHYIQLKYRHCIEVMQEYLLTKELSIKEIKLIEFQHYVWWKISYLDDSTPTKENDNLVHAKPRTYKGKLIDDLERGN